jgi:hypothetical protein
MVARLLITTRMVRLFLNEKIYPACERILAQPEAREAMGPDRVAKLEAMQRGAEERGEQQIYDLLAIVPYLWDPRCNKPEARFTAAALVWPLALVAQSEVCPPDAKEYAMACLRKLAAQDASVPQAAEAVAVLEEGGLPEQW